MITKKEITITGYAVNPIKVGEPALIAESNGDTRRTSKVVNISNNTDTEIRFETKNSFYTLYKKNNAIAGAMLKKMFEMRDGS